MNVAAETDDLSCPLCGYNLRGLETPRCPECGYAFDWDELRRAATERHPFLFEHHPERNVRSFFATLTHAFWPPKFWRSVKAPHAVDVRRLLLYAAIVALPLITFVGVHGGIAGRRLAITNAATQKKILAYYRSSPPSRAFAQDTLARHGSFAAAANYLVPTHGLPLIRDVLREQPYVLICLLLLLWPVISTVALLVFILSIRRARVRVGHVLRCVVYSFDSYLFPTALLLAISMPIGLAEYFPNWLWRHGGPGIADASNFLSDWTGLTAWVQATLPIVLFAMVAKLAAAYRGYLRFPHAFAVVAASQVVVVLALLAICAGVLGR